MICMQLAETFPKAVPLLKLRRAWVSACSKATGLEDLPPSVLVWSPVLQSWGLLPQARWHCSWPTLTSELPVGIAHRRASWLGPGTIPGTILTSSSNWEQGQSQWEGLSVWVLSLQQGQGALPRYLGKLL